MLDIYFYQKGDKEVEVGMIFHLFASDKVCNEFHTFESDKQAKIYMHQTKVELIVCNLEFLAIKYRDDPSLKNQLRLTAEERIMACYKWVFSQKDKAWEDYRSFKIMCQMIAKIEQFMTTLVNSLQDEEREHGIYYWKTYFDFIRSEAANGKNLSHQEKQSQRK